MRRTMLHELVHNEISEHSDKFYTRLEEVYIVVVCVDIYVCLYIQV